MRRWYFLTLALVGAALGLLSPAPAFASTYVGDALDRREAAANYLGYGWAEQSTDLKNELGNEEDPDWDYNGWQAWINSMSKAFGGGYWVTSYEGAMLVDARDRAKADFEKALARLDGTYGFEGSGGGDIPDSGSTSDSSTSSNVLIKTYFVHNDSSPASGSISIPPDFLTKMQGWANQYGLRYFAFCESGQKIYSNYGGPGGQLLFFLVGFTDAPTFEYSSGSKRYVGSGSGYRYVVCIDSYMNGNTGGNVSGNYRNATILPNKSYSAMYSAPDLRNLRFVSDVMQFNVVNANVPSIVGGDGGTVNVYEGDTSNITANIDNSSTTVENSTTVYDTENNTYTTVNNITTNNNVDVSAITKRLDSINAKVGQIGTDLNSLVSGLDTDIKTLFAGIGTTINNGVTTLRNQLVQVVSWLQVVDSDLRGIDKSVKAIPSSSGTVVVSTSGGGGSGGSNADVDLSTIESDLDDIKGKLDALLVINGVDAAANVLQTLFDLLNGIMNAVGEKLGAIGSALSGLTEVFPFSIPWDVAAMAALFAADPVTPVFDVPLPAPNGGTQNFHVDLSALDPVASVFRSGEMVLFALGLALRTRDMMGGGDDIA